MWRATSSTNILEPGCCNFLQIATFSTGRTCDYYKAVNERNYLCGTNQHVQVVGGTNCAGTALHYLWKGHRKYKGIECRNKQGKETWASYPASCLLKTAPKSQVILSHIQSSTISIAEFGRTLIWTAPQKSDYQRNLFFFVCIVSLLLTSWDLLFTWYWFFIF